MGLGVFGLGGEMDMAIVLGMFTRFSVTIEVVCWRRIVQGVVVKAGRVRVMDDLI